MSAYPYAYAPYTMHDNFEIKFLSYYWFYRYDCFAFSVLLNSQNVTNYKYKDLGTVQKFRFCNSLLNCFFISNFFYFNFGHNIDKFCNLKYASKTKIFNIMMSQVMCENPVYDLMYNIHEIEFYHVKLGI